MLQAALMDLAVGINQAVGQALCDECNQNNRCIWQEDKTSCPYLKNHYEQAIRHLGGA